MDHLKKPVIIKGFKDENYPYFFRNDGISNGKQTYIIQKASSVGQALAICDRWKREKFNITDSTHELLYNVPYIKYLYNSNNDITKIKVTPEDNEEDDDDNKVTYYHKRDYEILMYLKDGRVNVVAMLPYNHKEKEEL